MEKKKDYIKAEEVCVLLNKDIGSDIFTVTSLLRLVKKGLVKRHDLRTPGSKKARNFFIFNEVKECLEQIKNN